MMPRQPRFAAYLTSLILGSNFATISGCRSPQPTGDTSAYVDNGKLWAYGAVTLTTLDVPGALMLTRQAGDQTLNKPPTYTLFGAVKAVTADAADTRRDLAFVDFDPLSDRAIAFAYTVDFQPRAASADQVDVFAVLMHPGRTSPAQRIWLGMANFPKGGDHAALALGPGLKVSLIAGGVFSGQWAMHFAPVKLVDPQPFQGICPKAVVQMPGQIVGQMPNQTPGQSLNCRPLPAQQDLCAGDPTQQASCHHLPGAPTQVPIAGKPQTPVQVSNGAPQADNNDANAYVFDDQVESMKITFVSSNINASDDAANASGCPVHFLPVTRTLDRQVNSSCILEPQPAAPVNGKLACAVRLKFNQPQTYLEKVCNVVAWFKGDKIEIQQIQVLKK